ncbi:MAG: hypothetical protein KJ606_14060 [Chloroflexi bacterium]|nr:hypothetical protein [Chloroflexota bacterium]
MHQIPPTPEILVPRLGEYLVQQGYIRADNLKQALAYQREEQNNGRGILLGDALMELKMIDRPILNQAITEQILQLRQGLADTYHHLESRVQERTAELQEALRKLSELDRLKANFIANLSHELRTPLLHIQGYIEMLATESPGLLNEEQKSALQASQPAIGQLAGLIDDLIQFSVAQRDEVSLPTAP